MFCPNCGKQIPDGSVFCPECGANLAATANGGSTAPFATPTPSVTPTAAYDSLGTSYQTPPTMVAGGVPRSPKKPGKWKAVLIVVAIVVVALGGGLVYLKVSGNQLPFYVPVISDWLQPEKHGASSVDSSSSPHASGSEDTSGRSDAQGSSDTGTSATSDDGGDTSGEDTDAAVPSPTPKPSGKYADLVGTWTGTPTSEVDCVAAQSMPIKLTVKSVADNGTMVADVTVCYHNHDHDENNSTQGDEQVTFSDVSISGEEWNDVMTYTYRGDVSSYNGRGDLSITITYDTKDKTMDADVQENSFDWDWQYDDRYVLAK